MSFNERGPPGRCGSGALLEVAICMRRIPILVDVAVVIVMWTAVLTTLRRDRRVAAAASAQDQRSVRLMSAAGICAAVGVTLLVVGLMLDSAGMRGLYTLSAWAAPIAIGVGAVLSGYAAWVKGGSR
jgi:hypothetical protein